MGAEYSIEEKEKWLNRLREGASARVKSKRQELREANARFQKLKKARPKDMEYDPSTCRWGIREA